jgi:hypothetical protein
MFRIWVDGRLGGFLFCFLVFLLYYVQVTQFCIGMCVFCRNCLNVLGHKSAWKGQNIASCGGGPMIQSRRVLTLHRCLFNTCRRAHQALVTTALRTALAYLVSTSQYTNL